MPSPVVKRSVIVAGRNTSVSLEQDFWDGLKEITKLRGLALARLVGEVDANRQENGLSSAIRLYVLHHFRSRAAPQQASAAGGQIGE